MVEGLATVLSRLDEHLQVLHHLLLSAEVAETQRAQGVLKVFLTLGEPFFTYVKIFVYHTDFSLSVAKVRIIFVILPAETKKTKKYAEDIAGREPLVGSERVAFHHRHCRVYLLCS